MKRLRGLACSLVLSLVTLPALAAFHDRVAVSSVTTGTGTITLGSAISGPYQTFAGGGVTNSESVRYVIVDGAAWEIGLGTYSSSGTTLTRGAEESSAGGAAISLDGSETVFLSATATDFNGFAGSSGVASFNTRTGAVTLTGGDVSGAGGLLAANNLSDVASAATARTSLGLGTFATQNYAAPPAIGGTTPAAGSFSSLTDSGISGLTQCVHASSTGVFSGTGSDCGSAGGGITQLTGDGTAGPGSGSQAFTLATVNSNVGTFQGMTVNGKGQVTAASNQSYLTANQTITLSGGATGSGTTSIGVTLANPSASTLGGIESAAAVTHEWIDSISTSGVPHLSQPASGDISGLGTFATQNYASPPAIGGTTPAAGAFTTLSATGNLTTNITSGGSQCVQASSAGVLSGTGSLCGSGGAGITQLTGDVTAGPGSGSQAATLATVNSNVGTFQGLTVNGKGLITAASNQSYLTGNQTITLSGDATGSGTTAITVAVTELHANILTSGDWCNSNGTIINCAVTPVTNTNQLANGAGFITGNQTITLSGDTTGSGTTAITTTTAKLNGVSYGTSPSTNTVPVITSANTATYEAVPNAALANSSMTIAGHSVSLGGTQAIACADLSNGATGCSTATGTSGATIPLLNGANTWSGAQNFNSSDFVLKGATSGTLTVNAAAIAGSNTLTLPAGTTDFSSTGGASQVVKQTSAGGAFTVGQLACVDLSTACITANQTITLSGGATGSGTTAITVTLGNPGASTLGGIESIVSASHEWIDSISTSGVPHQSQPAFTDISGTNSVAQIAGSGASHAVPVDVAGTPTWKVIGDCQDSAGNHLNYTQSTDTFSCGTTSSSGTLTVTDGTHSVASTTTATFGNGFVVGGSAGSATVNLAEPNSTRTSSYQIAAGDMAGQVNYNGSSLTATIPAISSTVFASGMSACITNRAATALTISTTPTINGLVSASSVYQYGWFCGVSNGTTIDAFGFPGFGALSGDGTATGAGVLTVTKTNGTAFGTFATQNYATPPAIGGTTPAAGTFTTLSFSAVNVGPTTSTACTLTATGNAGCSSLTANTGDCGTFIKHTANTQMVVTIPATLTVGCQVAFEDAGTFGAKGVLLTGSAVSAATLHSGHSYTGTYGQYSIVGITIDANSGGSAAIAAVSGDGA